MTTSDELIGRWSSNSFVRYLQKQIEEFTLGVSTKMLTVQVFCHIPSITSTSPKETEYGMLALLMLGRSMKLEDGIFLSLKGLAEGKPYFKNVVQSQPESFLYSVSSSFLTSCVGRSQTDLNTLSLWVQMIVCCIKATGGKVRGQMELNALTLHCMYGKTISAQTYGKGLDENVHFRIGPENRFFPPIN